MSIFIYFQFFNGSFYYIILENYKNIRVDKVGKFRSSVRETSRPSVFHWTSSASLRRVRSFAVLRSRSRWPLIAPPVYRRRRRSLSPTLRLRSAILISFSSFHLVLILLSRRWRWSQDKARDLSMKIEEGFGANGLGIITVSDVCETILFAFH